MNRRNVLFTLIASLSASLLYAGQASEAQAVEMKASDGMKVTGTLYGTSHTALILCHGRGYLTGADSFAQECRLLQARGLMCLAINFRGYPAKAPPDLPGMELDVLAAFDLLARRGARSIYLLGSSMGGVAVYKALEELKARPRFAGFIILSASYPRVCRRVGGRKLFVVAEDDRALYPKVLATFIEAGSPKQAVVFRKGGHGQALLKTHREELLDLIALLASRPPAKTTNGP